MAFRPSINGVSGIYSAGADAELSINPEKLAQAARQLPQAPPLADSACARYKRSMTALSAIAHGRSGDKGNHANVAVIAYSPAGFDWLKANLTAERVAEYFAPLAPSRVVRYEAANLLAFNFLLHNVLAGGASRSLRSDTQGKTLALALLRMAVDLPANHQDMLRPVSDAAQKR